MALDEINRRAELVEVMTAIMERIYPVWVADTRAGELVEALEKWLDSRIVNIDGGPGEPSEASDFQRVTGVKYAGPRACATDGCDGISTVYFEAGGVGSSYCQACAERVRELGLANGHVEKHLWPTGRQIYDATR